MEDRLDACFEIVPQALKIVCETREETIDWKGPADPVSAADKASRDFLVSALRGRFPGDEIICEDAPKYPGVSGYRWLCDPLDGTLNHIRDGAPWAVSVALLRGQEIIAGCVGVGKSHDVFKAVLGGGAYRNEERIQVSELSVLKRSLIGFDCPYDEEPRNHTTYPALKLLLGAAGALRCYGSCAVALCLVAAGEMDAYVVEHGKPWDFAAGMLIVREAQGTVTTWSDMPYEPLRNVQVLASNSRLHQEIVTLMVPFDAKETYGPGARGKAGRLNAFWLEG